MNMMSAVVAETEAEKDAREFAEYAAIPLNFEQAVNQEQIQKYAREGAQKERAAMLTALCILSLSPEKLMAFLRGLANEGTDGVLDLLDFAQNAIDHHKAGLELLESVQARLLIATHHLIAEEEAAQAA